MELWLSFDGNFYLAAWNQRFGVGVNILGLVLIKLLVFIKKGASIKLLLLYR